MKAKTIRAICKGKHKQWMKSIDNESVRNLVEKNTIITGGAIASMLLNEEVNDFDIYFRNKETCLAVAQYYVEKFNNKGNEEITVTDKDGRIKVKVRSAGVAATETDTNAYQYFEGDPDRDALAATEYVEKTAAAAKDKREIKKGTFSPVFLSSNAITLSDKVQLIIRFYGEPSEIHQNFDFVHCTNYWDAGEDLLILRKEALEALLTRELRYVGSKYPLCSIIRSRKFIQRGWTINGGQYLKMAMQLNDLDLKDVDVLEEQLIGVDTAYFLQLIHVLRSQDAQKVDSTYLMELVDDIF